MRQIQLGTPPQEYSQAWANAFARDVQLMFASLNNPSRGEFTTVNISQLPTSATGLRSGDLWNDSGTVKVAS
jgi:hypothetical protein